jgi:hypothetical protein
VAKPLMEYVQQVLAEHGRNQKIREAFDFAMEQTKALTANMTCRRKGTMRALFWEFAVDKLIELTTGDPGLHIIEHNDTISFIFDDAVLVRLKKANISLATSNYPTPTAEMFHEHEVDLFGFSGLQRVEAIYIPNRFDTDIIWMGIAAHDADRDLWHFELPAPMVAPVPMLPQPVHPPTAELAKLKNQAKDEKTEKDGDGDA